MCGYHGTRIFYFELSLITTMRYWYTSATARRKDVGQTTEDDDQNTGYVKLLRAAHSSSSIMDERAWSVSLPRNPHKHVQAQAIIFSLNIGKNK